MQSIRQLMQLYPILYDLTISLTIVLIAWVLGRTAVRALSWISGKFTAKTESRLDHYLMEAFRLPVTLLILIWGLHIALDRLRRRDYSALQDYWNLVAGVLFIAAAIIAVITAIQVITAILKWYRQRIEQRESAQHVADFVPLVSQVGRILFMMIGIIVIFDHFGINIESIVVTLGVGGLAVGLALQDTLANIFAGITIMVDRPFRINDRIQVPSGAIGDVVAIGMRSTRIRTLDNQLLVIPNKTLVNDDVINHSYPDARVRVQLKFGVAYGTDIERTRDIVEQLALSHPLVLKNPPPKLYFSAFGESALELTLIFWLENFTQQLPVVDALNFQIDQAFRENTIEMPFPQRVLHMRQQASPDWGAPQLGKEGTEGSNIKDH
ncbi:MAG: mechanosensitive ion channel family protein [Acidobacteria bacterium]|nr:mechanosensitive ion channel family protein [Acidobacteriota bacterium]